MIKILHITPVLSHMVLLTIALCLFGCGGSSVENPLRESEETDNTLTQGTPEDQSLNVKVEVSKDTVQVGETVNITATVNELRGYKHHL